MIAQFLVMAALFTQSPDIDVYEIASEFIACAGFFDAAANEYDRRGAPMTGEEYRGAARGARVVAEAFAIEAIADPERREVFLEAGYENAFVRHSAAAERGEIIPTEAQRCFDLQPLQIELLNALRRHAYEDQE